MKMPTGCRGRPAGLGTQRRRSVVTLTGPLTVIFLTLITAPLVENRYPVWGPASSRTSRVAAAAGRHRHEQEPGDEDDGGDRRAMRDPMASWWTGGSTLGSAGSPACASIDSVTTDLPTDLPGLSGLSPDQLAAWVAEQGQPRLPRTPDRGCALEGRRRHRSLRHPHAAGAVPRRPGGGVPARHRRRTRSSRWPTAA